MRLLEPQQSARIEGHLVTLLDRLLDAGDLGPFRAAVGRYVLRGGKRVRPQLTLWTYLHALDLPHDAEPPPAVLDLACAWELFHAFLLIHDDIIDGSDTRRDEPSLHRQLQSLDSNSPRFGMNLGIVAGDLLFSATMRLLADVDVPNDAYRPLLRLFTRVASTTGFGQAIDIVQSHVPVAHVDEATLLRGYHWKTAAYTFEGPMLSGGVLAGLDAAAQDAVARFALSLGQAYQMQNDLLDLSRQAAEGCDLVEAKRTVTLLRTRSGLSDAARGEFDRRLRAIELGDGHAVQLAEEFRQELLAHGAVDRTRVLIDGFLDTARTAAADSSLPPSLSIATRALLDALTAQYFVAVV